MTKLGYAIVMLGSIVLIVCLIALALTSCTPAVAPQTDHGCPGACAQLLVLDCPEAVQCEPWCESYHAVGYMRPFAACVAVAGDVEAARACGLECNQ